MPTVTTCAHCQTPIVNPSTRVISGDQTFCCPNCAYAMEVTGSGSDPDTMRHGEKDFRCTHCGTPIVDEMTMAERGNDPFCCPNCLAAEEAGIRSPLAGSQGGR
ncbi:MAG: hypothetical protein IT305_25875 [Chloroflexi bacterium]|nr:hypothetical protein [Chloroflexota bacterium]